MIDVGELSRIAHGTFEVPITITRGIDDPVDAAGVLHLDTETLSSEGGVTVLVRGDAISVMSTVDLKRGDLVHCADSRAVPEPTTWAVTDRKPVGDDGWIRTWAMKKVED